MMKNCDPDIDDMDERALNMFRRERSDPQHAPDEPAPLTLKPFDCEPGDESCVINYTYRNELTTIGEIVSEIAERVGAPTPAVSLVHHGQRLEPLEYTLSDCNVHAGYVVYFRIDHSLIRTISVAERLATTR